MWGLRTKIGLEGRLRFKWEGGQKEVIQDGGIENEFLTILSVPDTVCQHIFAK